MRAIEKREVPVGSVRRWLEPGPVVLVSSHWRGRSNVMTLGWHTVMEFTPSLVGCVIAASNYSFELVRRSGQCVINLPTVELLDVVVRVGNTSGAEIDKFSTFGLTAEPALAVEAPAIAECHAHFECRLFDDALVERYNFFIFEVVRARVAATPEHPRTVHYLGEGRFMVAGEILDRRALFRPEML
ncbi:MAG: flavin reductase family protein [Geminicoccaceae bacterium]|nr:flavin reductase family protein [Geminicoccaceae bacterium]MCS7267043.1 flavin reductase family protein [Geminicoccaceae bacterium]MDW8125423.1 flavin reductase family protein [Geminicoccaceae bacterium]MDW8342255.1 flavin reductase family protein [Geminicoccaceae bacterium]